MDSKPVIPKKVMLEKIYLRCSKGCFWFRERNHPADTEYILASRLDKLKEILKKYSLHLATCAFHYGACTCGYEQALKESGVQINNDKSK